MSVCLKKLKSLTIEDVPQLEYVVGNYQQEQHSSYRNQNEELRFDLPALETLAITNAPKINGICTKNYKMVLSSPLDVQICDCGIKSFIDHNSKYASTEGVHLHAAHSLLVPSLKNVRRIKLVECCNLISLSTLSIATSTISLENLIIRECHKLKYIATYEGDAQVDKNCSIFPSLENLEIEDCEDLEFLFMSTISGGLKKLKYLTIKRLPKLNYIVGNYQQEQHSSNQNQNEELQFDLLHLQTLIISNAPNIKGVCTKNYKMVMTSLQMIEIRNCQDKSSTDPNLVNWRTTVELDSTKDRDPPFHVAQTLLVQSLKTVREIELVECWNLISLSTLSIASSTMALENLTIYECHKLKCITANDGVAQAVKYCSIFPRLENLIIEDCRELEFLFVSAISVGLGNLKSLTIKEVPELKYVVGNYQKQQHSFNQSQIDEHHFDLLALENLYIEDAPKMNSICAKNYKLLLSSPLNVQIWNCGIKSFTIQEAHASTKGAHPLFHAAQSLLIQSLRNIRKMELANCESLISMSSFSIASTILLEDLTIAKCHRLKCIVADEGGAGSHMNYNSIFPKLKELQVSDCDALEYLFPAYAVRSPLYLETLSIHTAPMLKYLFGRSQSEDNSTHENQIIQSYIDFPDLNDLSIKDVPQLVSICPENYYLRGLPLRSIGLGGFPKFLMRPCNQFLVFWHTKQQETKAMEMQVQTLEYLVVEDTKIEVIFDLTYMDKEKNGDGLEPLTSSLRKLELRNLSELVNLWMGTKPVMCFHSLQKLSIDSCKKLKAIFSTSMVRSLPMLKELNISACEELVHIVEEDYKTNVDDHLCHEPCFPNLEEVSVKHCDKLKYLFSVTHFHTLPKLRDLDIRKAHELELVLIRRGEMKKMAMEDVLPQLELLTLVELPNLISVCHGIDFQTLEDNWGVTIEACPNFSFYDTIATRLQTDPESADFEVEEEAKEKLSSHHSTDQNPNIGDASQQSLTKVPNHTSPNLTVLPARDNTQEIAKSFEDEEEEEETTTTPHGSKKQDFQVWEGTDQKLSSHSNGRRALETQQSTTGSSNFTRSDELAAKVARNERRMVDAQQSTKDTQNFIKGELVDKEVKKETNMVEPKLHSQEEVTRHDIQSHEEEKPEGGLIVSCTTPILSEQTSEAILTKSPVSSKASTGLDQTLEATLGKPIDGDDFQVYDESYVDDKDIKETNVVEDESKANSSDHVNVDPINLKQIEQESSSCFRGQIEHHDVTIRSDFNRALNTCVVQKIVEMMKLEGLETSLLEEALNTHRKLCLSINDRSKQMLCISYRVLIDILNILTTRTPFTITEADKRLLEEKLKDACLLGFDKDWLESIKTKAFNYNDISEVNGIQEILKGLENDLKSNEAMLEATRNREIEAARVVELAQKNLDAALQEHANVMAKHTHLLKARQHIISKQNHCWEMIAAKNKPLGF